ncbi:hypothetical protein CC78DRAFT_15294 [Lojkania enalia]|uniref:Heterokaryon incompatibility domain-containing protein n=1 Tax=Lojkania enalia TaxID=147567 RepID=A0A9P4KJ80_9PLEO|nr:hypothetical protein CC78DRAFT_15294 [Didymosphaeria enalia]
MGGGRYRYKRLQSSSAFRLFSLSEPKDTSFESPINFSIQLFDASIDECPEFDAVSYAWDGQEPTETITCNGKRLMVTRNVFDILLQARVHRPKGTFWVDSICINQSSTLEKNHQVPLMGSIYKRANVVWVYLGHGTCLSEATFKLLWDIARMKWNRATESSTHWEMARQECVQEFCAVLRQLFGAEENINEITRVLGWNWFHRLWPVQELVLAKHPILLCGSDRMPWGEFKDALEILQEVESMQSLTVSRFAKDLYDTSECYRHLRGMTLETNFVMGVAPPQYLRYVLKAVRTKCASDRRDKIYGVYGILREIGFQTSRVDYEADLVSVYTTFTRTIITSENTVDVLEEVCLPPSMTGLPSWVPDWSNIRSVNPIVTIGPGASKWLNSIIHELTETVLTVSGIIMDTIRAVARPFPSEPYFDEAILAGISLVKGFQGWAVVARQISGQYQTGETIEEAFFRTMTHNWIDRSGRKYPFAPLPHWRGPGHWMDIITANLPDSGIDINQLRADLIRTYQIKGSALITMGMMMNVGENIVDWPDEIVILVTLQSRGLLTPRNEDAITRNKAHKTLFVTDRDYLGLGPSWMQAGDRVALLSGGKVPFVVREERYCKYRLIGPAYIHGMMSGECWPVEKEKIQKISLI